MTDCPDKAHDEYRQRHVDAGTCHICEGEGCPLCYGELKVSLDAKDRRIKELEEWAASETRRAELLLRENERLTAVTTEQAAAIETLTPLEAEIARLRDVYEAAKRVVDAQYLSSLEPFNAHDALVAAIAAVEDTDND